MTQKMTDFLSSFGMMLLGVVLLLCGSVFFTHAKLEPVVSQLPTSEQRIVAENQVIRSKMFPVSHAVIPTMKVPKVCTVPLTADAVVAVDDRTNAVLFKKNATEIRSLASITKLMSALVLNDLSINWTKTATVTDTDIDEDHHLEPGEEYTLANIWDIALVGSSNSAIHVLVRNSGLTQDQFVARMNAKAQELGLYTMHFVEPTGLDSRDMGSAIDIAKLLKLALDVPKISQTLAMGEYDARPLNSKTKRQVWSTDWLLTNWVPNTFNKQSIVGKTGYIDESGYNFAVRITDASNRSIRVVVLGAASNEQRFSEARDVAEWVFDNYDWPEEHVASAAQP